MAALDSYAPPERHPRTLYTLTNCPDCAGQGQHRRQLRIVCMRCNAAWPVGVAEAHLDGQWGGWWGWRLWLIGDLLWQTFARLPCGCYLWHATWEPMVCQTCDGAGTLLRPATRREVFMAVGAGIPTPSASATQAHRIPGVPTAPPLTTF